MINGKRIAAVVPAYRVRNQVLGVLSAIGPEVDAVYVVDDACPEQSGMAVQQGCADPRVQTLFHEQNQGVGGAVVTGMKAALEWGADCIVKIDGDGQHDPKLIRALVTPLVQGDADYAKGNRFYWLEDVREMPFARLMGNISLSFVTKLSTGYWTVFDPTNGYVAIHTAVLRQIPLQKIDRRYFFESDMLFWLYMVQAKVVEIPMPARYGNFPSSLRPLRMIPYFLRRHVSNTGKRLLYSYFLRNFSIASIYLVVGLVSSIAGVADGAWEWWSHVQAGKDAPLGTIMIPTMMILVGVQLLVGFFAADVASTPTESIHPRLQLVFAATHQDGR